MGSRLVNSSNLPGRVLALNVRTLTLLAEVYTTATPNPTR
jgi:hypothetical protein